MVREEKNGKEKEEQKMSAKRINLIFLFLLDQIRIFPYFFSRSLFPLLSSPLPIFFSNETYQKTQSKGIGLFREGWMARGN